MMLACMLLSILFAISQSSSSFGIGSIVYVDTSNANISTRQYPKAQARALILDGAFALIVDQTTNAHNHSKWIIQSFEDPSIKLKIKEEHLKLATWSKQIVNSPENGSIVFHYVHQRILKRPHSKFHFDLVLWRDLLRNPRDKIIVLGNTLHDNLGFDRIIESEGLQADFAHGIAHKVRGILKDTNRSDPIYALHALFVIDIQWMEVVYRGLIEKYDAGQTPHGETFRQIRAMHTRSCELRKNAARIFHQCIECPAENVSNERIVHALDLIDRQRTETEQQLLAYGLELNTWIADVITNEVQRKCNIHNMVTRTQDLDPMQFIAHNIVKQYRERRGKFDTLHVLIYYNGAEQLEQIVSSLL